MSDYEYYTAFYFQINAFSINLNQSPVPISVFNHKVCLIVDS